MSPPRYFKPLSQANVTTLWPGFISFASSIAPATFNPIEAPQNTPSSLASRRHIETPSLGEQYEFHLNRLALKMMTQNQHLLLQLDASPFAGC